MDGELDNDVGAAIAVAVAVSVIYDAELGQPIVVFENPSASPVYGLAVFCHHHASLISRTYPAGQPHQGRKTLTEFSA